MVEPDRCALTSTPSIGPSSFEVTVPERGATAASALAVAGETAANALDKTKPATIGRFCCISLVMARPRFFGGNMILRPRQILSLILLAVAMTAPAVYAAGPAPAGFGY